MSPEMNTPREEGTSAKRALSLLATIALAVTLVMAHSHHHNVQASYAYFTRGPVQHLFVKGEFPVCAKLTEGTDPNAVAFNRSSGKFLALQRERFMNSAIVKGKLIYFADSVPKNQICKVYRAPRAPKTVKIWLTVNGKVTSSMSFRVVAGIFP